jgi:hypothetical protein
MNVVRFESLFLSSWQRAHQLADDAKHDLIRAAADRGQPHVAIKPTDSNLKQDFDVVN